MKNFDALLPKINQLIEQKSASQKIPGLSFAIVQGDEILLAKGYGFANLEHQIPATAESVYEIASITKLFTATAVMRLVESGVVQLDDPIGRYLPDLPDAWQKPTIRHALSHQSGIKDYTATEAYWESTRLDISQEELLSYVAHLPLQFEPGERYTYDNTGYYLLGQLIEAVSGRRYADYLDRMIFRPLEMSATHPNDPYAIVPKRAAGYTYDITAERLENKAYYSTTGTFSAGVLLSSAADLAKWATSLHTEKILKATTQAEMWTAHPSAAQNERQMDFSVGLGWFLVDAEPATFAGHNGSIIGFSSSLCHFIEHQLTLIMLCNQDSVTLPHEIPLSVATLILKATNAN